VAAQLVAEHDRVTFIGTPGGLEARLVPEAGIEFRGLPAKGFDRARPWTLLQAAAVSVASAFRAWRWLGELSPDVVIGFGAYVSLPLGLAAVVRRVPLVLHEQNSVPGLANRVLSRWAAAVAVTYEESAARLPHPSRAVLTGNPVRADVLSADRKSGRSRLGVAEDAIVLLVFGGSRGARHLNQALVRMREQLMGIEGLTVIHVTGPQEEAAVRAALDEMGGDGDGRWRVHPYLAGMGEAIAAADLVVSRAGATTIAELTALGAPAIVVPYPFATEDHQTKNAEVLSIHGAAIVVADSDLDGSRFGSEVLRVLGDATQRATMSAASHSLGRPDAAARVVAAARRAVAASVPSPS
jgi:UDP-N-acetylglucosamine--N-acetylmuramyl-(pentapeptide) pyrophosphoryl-undecaprenol N-acetylglucosamine transferase